ncbi:YggT family protein [Wenxinia marina]|uniref:Putative integral membrane protein n=2 Tax=Wenxinia TaxID=653686 RepID=A0A0D0QF46_9RHOB|nr:putative integral membrane protein [Wenxinia marina DSM 24838]GGL56039.1 YggT family protein [Wenxinia marina]
MLTGRDYYLTPDQTGKAAMQSLFDILMLLLSVAKFFIFAHFIMSWLISFQVLNVRQPFVYQVWSGLNRLLEPVYGPIRRLLPPMGGLDLAPLVALIGIYIIEIVLRNNVALFY